jgi:hypothetical protein
MTEANNVPVPTLQQKLAKIMGELGQFEKKGYNSFQKYYFVRAEDVTGAISPKLAKAGILLVPAMVSIQRYPVGDKSTGTLIEWGMNFVDSLTGETLSCKWWSEAVDTGDKGINKAATQAVKYFLLKFFLAGDDQDSDETDEEIDNSTKADKDAVANCCDYFEEQLGVDWRQAFRDAGVSDADDHSVTVAELGKLRAYAQKLKAKKDQPKVSTVRESIPKNKKG